MSKLKIPVKIKDKRRKDGFLFGPSYFLTFRLFTNDEEPKSPVSKVNPKVIEFEVDAEAYHSMEVDEDYLVSFFEHSDGRLYLQPE
jgi:hypothetical protein